jgi:hypothetical protein
MLKPKLTINGVDVTDLVVGQIRRLSSMSEPGSITSDLDFATQLDGLTLAGLDLRGRIMLEYTNGTETHRQFTGYVTRTKAGDSTYTLHCTDPHQILTEATTGGTIGQGLLPGEIIYYLLADTMPESTDKKLIHTGGGGTMEDAAWIFQSRRYMVVAPFPACQLPQREVKLGSVTLYIADNKGAVDDQIIAASLDEDTPTEWKEGGTRVRFFVRAEGFLDAFAKARERLQRIVDYVSFATNFATPSYRWEDGYRFYGYDRQRIVLSVSETAWLYVRDLVPMRTDRYWLRWFGPHRRDKPFALQADDSLLILFESLRYVVDVDDDRMSSRQRSLMSAIHALRRARQAPSTQDAAHHVFQCVEYIVTGYGPQKPELPFSNEDLKHLREAANETMRTLHPTSDTESQKRWSERIAFGLGKMNEPSLRVKWNLFCSTHNLTFQPADQEAIWNLRNKRNKDVHGDIAEIARHEIDRAAGILEKAIIAAIEQLVHPG